MILRRIVPNLNVDNATTGHDLYQEFLGLKKEFSSARVDLVPGKFVAGLVRVPGISSGGEILKSSAR